MEDEVRMAECVTDVLTTFHLFCDQSKQKNKE